MFTLDLYLRNSDNESPVIYTVKKPIFKDFYIGRQRDETDLLIVRYLSEGLIQLKNKDDFDAVTDYIYSEQDAVLKINSVWYYAQVSFSNPNFTAERVDIKLILLDEYSKLLDGRSWNSWGLSQENLLTKKYKVSDFYNTVSTYFGDGSQYMYDTQLPGSELWGVEEIIIDEDFDCYEDDIKLWNIGGKGVAGNDITIGVLVPDIENIDVYYKPTYAKYTDRTGVSDPNYQHIYCVYKREFRYFEESETVPDTWIIDPAGGTRVFEGFNYNKYVREYYRGNTYLSGKDVYFIRDESSTYIAAEFRGNDPDIQKSTKFYFLSELLNQLSYRVTGHVDYESDLLTDLYIIKLINYNSDQFVTDQFVIKQFIDFLRDKLRIYLEIKDDTVYYVHPDFNTKLLDIDSYINNENVIIEQAQRVFRYTNESNNLDFGNQILSFWANNPIEKTVNLGIITDPEITSKNEGDLILKIKHEFVDQIYSKPIYIGASQGSEAIFLSEDGKYIDWDDGKLNLAAYFDADIYSNTIYLDVDNEIQISYGIYIYDAVGAITVRIGNYTAVHNTTTTVNTTTTTDQSQERVWIKLQSTYDIDFRGFIYNLRVKVKTKVPEVKKAIISNRYLKNGELSANTITDYKPYASYPKGYLENYGYTDCNAGFLKGLNFNLPLDYDLFDYDINQYLSLDSEKYIIFEEKRQILTENKLSNTTIIKAKSNEIY